MRSDRPVLDARGWDTVDDLAFAPVRDLLQRLLGLDLSAYKQPQMRRRIDAFIVRHCDGDRNVFLDRVARDRDFLAAVRDMLTINVTEFFRDSPQWARLEKEILPGLIQSRASLSVWSAGCSRGQEPISLAIAFDRMGALQRTRILATDFDRAVLADARAGGPYGPAEVAGLSPADRKRYFEERAGGLVAGERVRSHIRTQELNLLRDPFGRDFDLVVCRNVMIYFEPDVKRALVRKFMEALRPGGVLFIGATEALLGSELDGFERLGGNFYTRVLGAAGRAA